LENKVNVIAGKIKLLIGIEFKVSFGKTTEEIKQ
jgi:hypothetical protein